MRKRIPLAFPALVTVVAALCGCSSPPVVYGTDESQAVQPAKPMVDKTANVRLVSRPDGANIVVNGVQIGTAPTTAKLEVDESGKLLADAVISADYSMFTDPRAAEVPSVRLRRGERPAQEILLFRSTHGGVRITP